MSAPFIFVSTNRLEEGKRDTYRDHLADFVPFVQQHEPQLLAFCFHRPTGPAPSPEASAT